MKNLLPLFFLIAHLSTVMAQSIGASPGVGIGTQTMVTVTQQIPASITAAQPVPTLINAMGLSQDYLESQIHETVVQCPALGQSVEVRAGLVPGDTSFIRRVFPLSAQTWADGTWVAPAPNGGWRIGIGRHLGINAMYVELRTSGQTIATVSWIE